MERPKVKVRKPRGPRLTNQQALAIDLLHAHGPWGLVRTATSAYIESKHSRPWLRISGGPCRVLEHNGLIRYADVDDATSIGRCLHHWYRDEVYVTLTAAGEQLARQRERGADR